MKMDQKTLDAGTFAAMLQRYTEYRLPRARRMLERVNGGECISDDDILWLKRVYAESRSSFYLVLRNPDYSLVYTRSIDLFAEITAKALANEQSGR